MSSGKLHTASKSTITIIGAGPAGMAAAFDLYTHDIPCTIIEKEDHVGGLAATYRFGEFLTDNGPHRFFTKNNELYKLIKGLLGERWIVVSRSTRFFINGTYFTYPIDGGDVLRNTPVKTLWNMMYDYAYAQCFLRRAPHNFEEYAIQKFGKTLARFNILNYTEKIWGIPCRHLSPDWGSQRIQDVSVGSVIARMFFGTYHRGPKSMVDHFYYPEFGTGLIYDEMHRRMRDHHSFLFQTTPACIEHNGRAITTVLFDNPNRALSIEHLISSMPLPDFIGALRPTPLDSVIRAARTLRYRSQVYLFLTINKASVTKHQWIYFPDQDIPFGRISEMKNFSSAMAPADKTSLFIEFFCWEGGSLWSATKEELFEMAMPILERLELVRRDEVRDAYCMRNACAYPVYELGYADNLKTIFNFLDAFENLSVIGRPGRFRYTNQDHSIEMGLCAARAYRERVRYDFDAIGGTKDYFEAGTINIMKKTS